MIKEELFKQKYNTLTRLSGLSKAGASSGSLTCPHRCRRWRVHESRHPSSTATWSRSDCHKSSAPATRAVAGRYTRHTRLAALARRRRRKCAACRTCCCRDDRCRARSRESGFRGRRPPPCRPGEPLPGRRWRLFQQSAA